MFNLFKTKMTEQQIIAQIHNEFDSAEDKLLSDANELLASLHITPESHIEPLAERLNKLGFTQVPVVKQATSLKQQREQEKKRIVKTQAQAELIKYYKQNYPFQKFITQTELDRICKKYTLNYAPVRTYIMDIPKKNLKEIEDAPALKEGDAIKQSVWIRVSEFGSSCPDVAKQLLSKKILFESAKDTFNLDDRSVGNALCKYASDKLGINIDYGWNTSNFRKFEIEKVNKTELFIAAPPTHFALEGLKKDGEFGYVDSKKMVVQNDPIVLRYVRGGIQVLSKWGLEAAEPGLVNEINN